MMASCINSVSLPTTHSHSTTLYYSSIKFNQPKQLVSSIPCVLAESRNIHLGNKLLVSHDGFIRSENILAAKAAAAAGYAGEGSERETEREAQKLMLQPELTPKHVAVIMDGNRRWAIQKGLSVEDGHKAGGRTMMKMARFFHAMGVKVLTVFAFSTENWVRPKEEVEYLVNLFEELTKAILDMAMEYQGRFSIIGDTSKLPKSLRKRIEMVETITKANRRFHFVMAINYGGKHDIIEATKAIATKVKDGKMFPEEINEKLFEEELQTKCIEYSPCPDLLIRTGGETRISNFMLWQTAYAELHFVDKYFPDVEEDDFMQALISFQQRQRRFGGPKYK